MKTEITVVGIGNRRSGTSKQGKPFDFTPVHVNYYDSYTAGLAATCLNVDQALEPDKIEIGATYEVYMHQQNFRQVLDGVVRRVDNA